MTPDCGIKTSPQRIFVTGGAGFIGSHLCEALLASGNSVFCYDDFCDFYAPQTKHDNLNSCKQNPGFEFEIGDIRNLEQLSKAVSTFEPDVFIHLAAMAGVRPSIQHPLYYEQVNITGTLNVLEACKAMQIDKLIFASSSSVYGNRTQVPFLETDLVNQPISPYAATKLSGELLCYNYFHLYQISTVCLRFFTVYGPRQRPDLAIHRFTDLISKGQPLTVFGDGNSSRDYTYITDTISGILKAIDYLNHHSCYEIINLGEEKTIPLMQLISCLEEICEKKAKLNYLPTQEGDVGITFADITKARMLLGYEPKTQFKEGLISFYDWYKSHLSH